MRWSATRPMSGGGKRSPLLSLSQPARFPPHPHSHPSRQPCPSPFTMRPGLRRPRGQRPPEKTSWPGSIGRRPCPAGPYRQGPPGRWLACRCGDERESETARERKRERESVLHGRRVKSERSAASAAPIPPPPRIFSSTNLLRASRLPPGPALQPHLGPPALPPRRQRQPRRYTPPAPSPHPLATPGRWRQWRRPPAWPPLPRWRRPRRPFCRRPGPHGGPLG